jgi:hypothetical protein
MSHKIYPWKNGYYRYKNITIWVLKIEGDEIITFHTGCLELQTLDIKESMKGIIKHGFFGKTSPEISKITGKYLSEALIFASTNRQCDDRLFIELGVQYMKITSSEQIVFCFDIQNNLCTYTTCSELAIFMY